MTLRIMHIELGRQLYGGAKQVEYLIRALDPAHYANILVCTEGSAISALSLPNCTVVPLPCAGDVDIRFPFLLNRSTRQYRPDIVHVHSRRGADVWGGLVARYSQIPAVCTRRVDNPESWLAKLKYRYYHTVVSISEGVRRVVSQHCRENRVEVIHSAVELSDYTHTNTRKWLEAHYVIPPGSKVIANFAQLIPRKGQAELIAAMGRVVRQRGDVICLLFGKGKQRDAYQQLIDAQGLREKVRLCGFSDDVARILPAIDVMVHPAHAEGLGVILLQGAACRCAMISCPVGGIPEIINHNQTGLLVPVGDVNRLSAAILDMLNNPQRARALGNAAYHHLQTRFTPDIMAKKYGQLYQHILHNRQH